MRLDVFSSVYLEQEKVRGEIMWKNFAVAAANILVSSIPLFATWDPIIGLCYCGIAILLLALLSWNIVGDYIVILFILHAREIPPNALITPSLQRYLRYLSNHELKNKRTPSLYYANSKIPYYIPVSARNAVISLALENRLQLVGERLLIKGVPKDSYIPKTIISRKTALLSLASYAIVIWIMELWAIFFAVAVKAIMALVMLIASGALFGSVSEMVNTASLGSSIGSIILKINEIASYIQDKLVDFVMKITCINSYRIIEESSQV